MQWTLSRRGEAPNNQTRRTTVQATIYLWNNEGEIKVHFLFLLIEKFFPPPPTKALNRLPPKFQFDMNCSQQQQQERQKNVQSGANGVRKWSWMFWQRKQEGELSITTSNILLTASFQQHCKLWAQPAYFNPNTSFFSLALADSFLSDEGGWKIVGAVTSLNSGSAMNTGDNNGRVKVCKRVDQTELLTLWLSDCFPR